MLDDSLCCCRYRTFGFVYGALGTIIAPCLIVASFLFGKYKILFNELCKAKFCEDWQKYIYVAIFIIIALGFVNSILLMVGTLRKKPFLIIGWLIALAVEIFLRVILFAIMVDAHLADGQTIISSSTIIGINVICFCLVYMLYKQVREELSSNCITNEPINLRFLI